MIDITFDCNTIEIEGKEYNHLGDRDCLREALQDLLEKACYSGETITLWEASGDKKNLIGTYYSSNKTRLIKNDQKES